MAQRMLPRILSAWNVASRKQAEAMVAAGRVRVDGRVVRDVTAWASETAKIELDGVRLGPPGAFVWWALNKPRGVITTTDDPEGRRTVLDLVVSPAPGLAPVGRLDLDSAGLLLLTNDHGVAAKLLAPESHLEKRYRVKVTGVPTPEVLAKLGRETLEIEGLRLGPIQVTVASSAPKSAWLDVTLREGKNRQIRRQLAHHGHDVEVLIRTAFGPVELAELAPGALRPLTPLELAALAKVGI